MDKNIIEEKKLLRKSIKVILNTISEKITFKNECKEKISSNLKKSLLYKNCDFLLSFLSLDSEISTDEITSLCFTDNKKIFVPRICEDNLNMIFYQLDKNQSLEQQTEKNIYNISEPVTSLKKLENTMITDKTIILIPGLAFSADGSRLGRGKGFYDTFLSQIGNCIKIGLCYSFQIIDSIPLEKHDLKVDYLLTEKNLLLCKKDI